LLAHATTPAIAKLVTTLNAHLPALFEVADEEAAFVEQTVSRVGKSAQALGDPSTLDAKSGSCAACAARSASHSGRVMSASVDASVRLLQACRESAD